MPGYLLRAYVDAMPKLRAEESLSAISETAAGSGVMEAQDQRSYRSGLLREAGGGPRATKADPASLALMGINVQGTDTSPGGVVLPAGVRGR